MLYPDLSGPVPKAAADERRPHLLLLLLGQPRFVVDISLESRFTYRRTDTMRNTRKVRRESGGGRTPSPTFHVFPPSPKRCRR
jgi:hypothetical protein